ncbi:MAG: diguanylate cyclase [Syntrophaceae bacterium]
MEQFPGYTVVEQMGETLHSVVYRARPEGAPGTVIIKALKARYPAPAEVARLKHEYELIKSVAIDGIVKILEIIDDKSHVALVVEDFGGVTLKEIIKGGFTIERFLEIAIRLSEILGKIHQHNITHRDIKPLNIIMNWEEDIVKITDFGIASEITRLNEEIYNPQVIEGTLVYMSPEQTGRMNCAVDYRTDLYSLGVTFYEMLTGQLPFSAPNSLEIIHAHIAKLPLSPEKLNPDIPLTVADIIMKLLSKSAADRYQNGFGLAADLKECLDQLRAKGRITPFELGRRDISLKFIIPQIVVGRGDELAAMQGAFERIGRGGVEVVLVTGEPGIGKSALVGEMHKPIVERRGYFLSGKYDQFRQYVPYSSIIQAFQGLARQLLAESDDRIQEWKERLLLALGPNGKIITDAIPDIELIIGRQPDIPELGPEETQNRFSYVFKCFVRVFARQSHPLVLFLDDLQWADSASINLLQTILLDKDLRFLLFIGSYRDNEVALHHPLMLAIDTLKKAGLGVGTIALGALSSEDVNQLVSSFLRLSPEIAGPLSQSIHGKTRGNPFFVNQFIKTLYVDGRIFLKPDGDWSWDLQKIRDLAVTDNVVDFMAVRLRDLPADPLRLIRICACIGNRFETDILSALTERSLSEVLAVMDVLIQEGLIDRRGDLYRFHHDRIQEAAYSLFSPAEREEMHFAIGTLGLERTEPDKLFSRIFYIVDQLNQGRRLITEEAQRLRLAELNAKAGIKAKEATAYKAAVSYLDVGLELLGAGAWRDHYELCYTLHKEQMECRYLDRDFEAAERLFAAIIAQAKNRVDKAKAYTTMVVLYTNLRTPQEAIELGLKAMLLFGYNLSVTMGAGPVLKELIKVKMALRKMPLEKLLDLPLMTDEERITISNLMTSIGTPAYYVNANLFAYLSLYGVNESLKYGHTPNSAVAFIALATIIQTVQGDYEQGYRIGEMALKLNEMIDNKKVAGLVHHVFAFMIQHWKLHARKDLAIYAKVYQLSLDAGDFIYAGHSINAAADCRLMIGDRIDDIHDEIKKYRELITIVKEPFIASRYLENIQVIQNLKGLTPSRASLSGDGFDQEELIERMRREKNHYGLCCSLLLKAKLLYLYGLYEEARQAAEELDRHIKAVTGTLLVPEHFFYYSLILAALLTEGAVESTRRFQRLIVRNQRKLKTFIALCPENFRHKYLLVEAEQMAADGRFREAVGLYHDAVRLARHNEYLHEEALACERTAVFYRRHHCEEEARVFMHMAGGCYLSWGASSKEKELQERYPELMRGQSKAHGSDTVGDTTSTQSTSRLLDLATVMQVSQVISSEIMLERLLQKTMHMSIVNAGAQRGYLILESDGKLTVEASEDVDAGEARVLQTVALEECEGLSQAIVHYVSRSGKHLILANAMSEGAFMNDPHVVREQCKSILCTPILNKGKLTGVLYMENNLTAGAFTPERLEILRLIAAQAAISLENAKLFDLATTDGLTKLFVHRYFQLMLDGEVQRARRYNRPFSLAMIDIDNFKHFNDTYGHLLGDEVLKSVARAIRKNIRAVDIAARYGGEEFVVIFPETDVDKAMIAAEKIRRCVELLDISYESLKLHVTISLGLSSFPRHALGKEALIKSADGALYVSKRAGKNCINVGERVSED